MKLAIMQPYFFPYLGYFQLINSVDKFVVLDDVQYINRGWINRNRILLNRKSFNIVLPVKKDSTRKKINEMYFTDDIKHHKYKLIQQLEHAYKKAPFYKDNIQIILDIILNDEKNIAKFNTFLLSELCRQFKMNTQFYVSSGLICDKDLHGEDKILYINRLMASDVYVNPVSGMELYNKVSFHNAGIALKFLVMQPVRYRQLNDDYLPDLSVIDALMFNSLSDITGLMNKYQFLQD